jgi:hypothetical protein
MIITDSSLTNDPSLIDISPIGSDVRVGIVRGETFDKGLDSIIYIVEVNSHGLTYALNCIPMVKFGDVFNYEERGFRSWGSDSNDPIPESFSNRVGEVVLVSHLNSSPSNGVIIGSLRHPARKKTIKEGVSYISEFNGLETSISDSGEYKITYKGLPTNVKDLDSANGRKLPEPKYDKEVTGSYFTFKEDGSYEVSDGAESDPQSFSINKPDGNITIVSGKITITIDKKNNSTEIISPEIKVNSEKLISVETPEFSVESNKSIKLSGKKIAIGTSGTELIDSLIKIIEGIGDLTINSPVGPCSPFKSAPTWVQIESIKSKLSSIKGSL